MSDKKNKNLKPGWLQVKFGDVVRLSKARSQDPLADGFERYVGLEHLEPGDLRIRSWGNVADGVTFTSVFQPGQVLFGKRRAYQRKVAVADFSGVCSGDIYVLETKDARVLMPELLPFICQTDAFFDYAVGTSAGSLSPRTNWTSLADFAFALPPMKEQSEIVQVLEAIRECADAYQASEAALKALLLSRTGELFSGPMDDEAKAQVIGDIADVQYGLTINAKRRTLEKQSPYLRVANVQRFHIDLSEVKDVGVDSKDDGCILRRNDILVVEGHADIAELGRASIWEEQLPICLHQNHLIRIRCRPEVDPYYVLEYVNSPAGRAYFRGRGKSTSGLNTLNSTVVRKMPIPIPPLAIQNSIAGELKAARRNLKQIADRKEHHATISKRLSTEIFGGGQG
ncbi:restriction endonuclease subunit S [Burkholderia sp. ZZQ-2]|uniref:restriction endonuclease subunit S n=1 Tax=Burkholderia sp. ZZQ-2 TaxID=1661766 RepID=UPI003D6E408F